MSGLPLAELERAVPAEAFDAEALKALDQHPNGLTLMRLLGEMHRGAGFTPREARGHLQRLEATGEVQNNGEALGRKWSRTGVCW